jgi:GT2 family glycosyltransferase
MGDINQSTFVVWCDPGTTEGGFALSLARLAFLAGNDGLLAGIGRKQSGPRIEDTRNDLVRGFLDNTDAEWLLMVDSDMTFPPDALHQLHEHADPETVPVVGGLCFGYQQDLGPFPTLYSWGTGGARVMFDIDAYPELCPVDATGAAFLMVHRRIFEQYAVDTPLPWFRRSVHDNQMVGEDITFCIWLRQEGVPIHVLTSLEIGHVKQFEWTRETYEANRPDLPALWVPEQDPLLVGRETNSR